MLVPKMAEAARELARRIRQVRKYRKACLAALGPLGTRIFREFLNLHGRLPIETTACWTEALAWVFGTKGTSLPGKRPERLNRFDLKTYRGQFGGWSQVLFHRSLGIPRTTGLRFAMRVLEIEGDLPKPWRARLFILYEHQFGVVFHDLKMIKSPDNQSGDDVWRILNQAVHRLGHCRWRYFDPNEPSVLPLTVAFPARANGKLVHPLYDEAISRQSGSDSRVWKMTTFKGLRSTPLKIGAMTFAELHWALRRQSRKVSAALRSLRPRRYPVVAENKLETGGPGRPAWLLLYPDEYPYDFQRYL